MWCLKTRTKTCCTQEHEVFHTHNMHSAHILNQSYCLFFLAAVCEERHVIRSCERQSGRSRREKRHLYRHDTCGQVLNSCVCVCECECACACVCVCVCERVRVCVFVTNQDIDLYNDTGMTQVLQGEGDFSGHWPMSPLFKTLINHTEWGFFGESWNAQSPVRAKFRYRVGVGQ